MAQLIVDMNSGQPRCAGCGERFSFIPWFLDSRRRVNFDGSGASSAPEVAAFASRHTGCREPKQEVASHGLVVTDRRRFR